MKINGGNNGPIRPDAARNERGLATDKTEQGGASSTRVDTVEISEAGRAKAAESTSTRSARLQDIRERILRGAYDTDEIVAEVARRIFDRGDLMPASVSPTESK
jgi:anti-sigma28 factor (negative regulator of flagellin synthesis)